jgi:hypothetical protein
LVIVSYARPGTTVGFEGYGRARPKIPDGDGRWGRKRTLFKQETITRTEGDNNKNWDWDKSLVYLLGADMTSGPRAFEEVPFAHEIVSLGGGKKRVCRTPVAEKDTRSWGRETTLKTAGESLSGL